MRERIVTVCNQPPYAHLPSSQIVPKLADQGQDFGSESSFYRVLKADDQVHHRGSMQVPRARQVPTTHIARGPNEVWTWGCNVAACCRDTNSPWSTSYSECVDPGLRGGFGLEGLGLQRVAPLSNQRLPLAGVRACDSLLSFRPCVVSVRSAPS